MICSSRPLAVLFSPNTELRENNLRNLESFSNYNFHIFANQKWRLLITNNCVIPDAIIYYLSVLKRTKLRPCTNEQSWVLGFL